MIFLRYNTSFKIVMRHLIIWGFILLNTVPISFAECQKDLIAQITATIKKQPRMGTVNRDGVAGAISKEADQLFTQYANNNDTEGITLMLLNGSLIHIPKGERVAVIEYGFATLKIRTKQGYVLYVAREHITLDKV